MKKYSILLAFVFFITGCATVKPVNIPYADVTSDYQSFNYSRVSRKNDFFLVYKMSNGNFSISVNTEMGFLSSDENFDIKNIANSLVITDENAAIFCEELNKFIDESMSAEKNHVKNFFAEVNLYEKKKNINTGVSYLDRVLLIQGYTDKFGAMKYLYVNLRDENLPMSINSMNLKIDDIIALRNSLK